MHGLRRRLLGRGARGAGAGLAGRAIVAGVAAEVFRKSLAGPNAGLPGGEREPVGRAGGSQRRNPAQWKVLERAGRAR